MQPRQKSLIKTILWVGFLVGTLDICSAFISYSINFPGRNPLRVLRYIASAVFNKEDAYLKDYMIIVGAVFHYIIAYSFTILFFLIYPKIQVLKRNRLVTGFLYGAFIWSIMNLIVVPATRIHKYPAWNLQAFIQMMILIVAIGIPLSYIAYWYYYGKKNSNHLAVS